jgi:hypothetical protein
VLIVTAQSASASGAAPITVANTTIANGQAQTVTFGSGAGLIDLANTGGIQQALCLYLNGSRQNQQYIANSTVPATLSVSAGTFDDYLNKNFKAVNNDFEWVWLDIYQRTGKNDQGCGNLPTARANLSSWSDDNISQVVVRDSATWTVTPALSSSLAQTMYLNENNTTPVPVTGSYLSEALGLASRTSKWGNNVLRGCDSNAASSRFDLAAMGLSLNTADSAIGEFAPLIISGTPTASSVGTHQVCLKLSTDSRDVYTFFNLTVAERPAPTAQAPAPTPTLAETGADSRLVMASGLIGTIAIGLGTAFLAFRRRMNAE